MEKVIAIMHDTRVYEALRRQAKINRRVSLFALLVTASMVFQQYTIMEQKKQIQALMEPKGE